MNIFMNVRTAREYEGLLIQQKDCIRVDNMDKKVKLSCIDKMKISRKKRVHCG